MTPLNRTALVVEDEFLVAELWRLYLETMGVEVCGSADTADEAVALARRHRPALVLMDMRLRGRKDGVDAALEIHETVGSRIVFVTASTDPTTKARIALDHPLAILVKPVAETLFQSTVTMALVASGASFAEGS